MTMIIKENKKYSTTLLRGLLKQGVIYHAILKNQLFYLIFLYHNNTKVLFRYRLVRFTEGAFGTHIYYCGYIMDHNVLLWCECQRHLR